MIFTTLEQALTYVTKNLQAITETLFEPQEEACKYIAAWIVSKQGVRDVQTIKNVLRFFSREMDSGSEFVTQAYFLEQKDSSFPPGGGYISPYVRNLGML